MGKEAEADGVLEGESMPVDLMAAAEHIDGVMLSLRKVGIHGLFIHIYHDCIKNAIEHYFTPCSTVGSYWVV